MTRRLQVDIGLGAAVGLLLGLWLVGVTWGYPPPPAWPYVGLWAVAAIARGAVVFTDSRRSSGRFLLATAHGALAAVVAVAAWLVVVGVWFMWSMSSFGP